jgi:hypothetical protein
MRYETLEVTPNELVPYIQQVLEQELSRDTPLRLKVYQVTYRGRFKVWKLKPLFDRKAPRKKL